MKLYKSDRCIGRDEKDYNKIFLGDEVRFKPFTFDYQKSIKPYLIHEKIKSIMENMANAMIFGRNRTIDLVDEFIIPILSDCIDTRFYSIKKALEFRFASDFLSQEEKLITRYSKRGGLAGWLAKSEYNFRTNGVVEGSLEDLTHHFHDDNNEDKINEIDKEFSREEMFAYITDENMPENKQQLIFDAFGMSEFEFNDLDARKKNKDDKFLNILNLVLTLEESCNLKSNIPKSMIPEIRNFVDFMFRCLSAGYQYEYPEELIDKIEFNPDPDDGFNSEEEGTKLFNMSGIRMGRDLLIIKGFEFNSNNENLWMDLMSFPENNLKYGVCFQDCLFNGNHMSMAECAGQLLFQNCYIEKAIRFLLALKGDIEFDECKITGALDFSQLQMNKSSTIKLLNCLFEKGSVLNLSETHSQNYLFPPSIAIKDTIIKGELDISGSGTPILFYIQNTVLPEKIKVNNTLFDENSVFENLYFQSNLTSTLLKSRKDLYDAMKKSGLEDKAKELDLLVENKPKKSGKIDMDAYQAAYATGYLNPDYAAFLLGRSTSYLAKKRANDRQRIVRDSLPFIVSGRDVQYPVEALLALKSQNWATLKELRQRYPIPKD